MCRKLKEANLTYTKPEQRYYESNKRAQQEWLKNELPKIKRIAKKHNAILYFEDEASIQLAPIVGKTWGPKGRKAIVKITGNRGSIAAMSAISKSGHLIFTLHRTKITSFEVVGFLKQMLDHHPHRHLVVVMDRARPHTANIVKEFTKNQERLHVSYLPSRSPELNPDEKVWNHLKNEKLKSHKATDLKSLKNLTSKKLREMSEDSSLVRGIFYRCEMAEHFII